ncbi:flagellar protein export ATPase FliI [Pyruvatibacter sp.]|uniref:flagellar protein export ATPase FliI n=1 Tax=Pyruvatibacter sp. TaxID=1981328 RepID=UPI0032EB4091
MKPLLAEIERLSPVEQYGRVAAVRGLMVELEGPLTALSLGSRVVVPGARDESVPCEVVGFRDDRALAMPFAAIEGLRMGAPARFDGADPIVHPSTAWLGRVVNAMGEPIDGKGPIAGGAAPYSLRGRPIPAHDRARVGERIDLGVRALNAFATTCRGQRMGIFAGSGVGKSVLLSMLARYSSADVAVIGLIGERGREVQEFIEDDLGEEGLARSVVVVATSDESALMRRQAAYLTMTLSEYFRDHGADALCLMDSLTRFATAQREIGLSGGEPPTTRGYTPTVFSELPRLLERAGPGRVGSGSITGLFTVLVEGDDHNEPVADAVRSILDGHIVMERAIAERGRYPAINVLKSVSRTMPDCQQADEFELVKRARALMSAHTDMEELIRIGAYRHGADATVDEAIRLTPAFEAFLSQQKNDHTPLEEGFRHLATILGPMEAQEGDQGAGDDQPMI